MPNKNTFSYDVTHMQNGHYRAECLYTDHHGEMCGWWSEYVDHGTAAKDLRHHMMEFHRIRASFFGGK